MSIGIDFAAGIFSLSELLLKLLRRARVTYRLGGIQIDFEEEKSVDERLAKIDQARALMADAMTAVDELHKEAETNKTELSRALANLAETEKNKNQLENELRNIRQIMQLDVATFKKLAGVPSKQEVKNERVIGFFTGVLASVVASGIVWCIVTTWPFISTYAESVYAEIARNDLPNKRLEPTAMSLPLPPSAQP